MAIVDVSDSGGFAAKRRIKQQQLLINADIIPTFSNLKHSPNFTQISTLMRIKAASEVAVTR